MTAQTAGRSQALLALHLLGAAWLSWRIIVLQQEYSVVSKPEASELGAGQHAEIRRPRSVPFEATTAISKAAPAVTPIRTRFASQMQRGPIPQRSGLAEGRQTITSKTAANLPTLRVDPIATAPSVTMVPPIPDPLRPTFPRNRKPVDAKLSIDGWAVFRPGAAADALVPSLGGSQAGFRVRTPLTSANGPVRISATSSLAIPLSGPGKEVSLGLTLRPAKSLPVELIIEQRFRLDHAGRTRMVLLAAGGVSGKSISDGWTLDGYAQGGLVGLRNKDLVADGSATITKAISRGQKAGVHMGGGLWGAAQPGAHRLDAGPVLVVQSRALPMRVSLEWRQRLTGNAAPGSGPAITVSGGF